MILARIFLIYCILHANLIYALNVDFHDVEIQKAIQLMAKFLKLNVIISPKIKGKLSLSLHHADPNIVFNLLLRTQNLHHLTQGKYLYIAPQSDLMKQKEYEENWLLTLEKHEKPKIKTIKLHYANAKSIAHSLKDEKLLSDKGKMIVDVRTNTIMLNDVQARIDLLTEMIKKMDIPIKQIGISVLIVSIDRDYVHELGITFEKIILDIGKKNFANAGSIGVSKLAQASLLELKLNALEKEGHAEFLSSPHLLTVNQRVASIESGYEVPYQEVSESGGTAQVFKKAVLSLKVLPQILPDNRILLKLKINQDRPSENLVQGLPIISTRQMITNILVKSKETIVLGGIYEVNTEKVLKKIPFLSDLPVIGWLLKDKKQKGDQRELLIFVTPKIATEL